MGQNKILTVCLFAASTVVAPKWTTKVVKETIAESDAGKLAVSMANLAAVSAEKVAEHLSEAALLTAVTTVAIVVTPLIGIFLVATEQDIAAK